MDEGNLPILSLRHLKKEDPSHVGDVSARPMVTSAKVTNSDFCSTSSSKTLRNKPQIVRLLFLGKLVGEKSVKVELFGDKHVLLPVSWC